MSLVSCNDKCQYIGLLYWPKLSDQQCHLNMSVVFIFLTACTSSEEQLGIILCIFLMLHLSDYSIYLPVGSETLSKKSIFLGNNYFPIQLRKVSN